MGSAFVCKEGHWREAGWAGPWAPRPREQVQGARGCCALAVTERNDATKEGVWAGGSWLLH